MVLELFNNNFLPPFAGTGRVYKKRTLKKRKETGVYIICENKRIVYIGMSQSCLCEALYRHFYYYNDTHRRPRHYYNVEGSNEYTVYIIRTQKDEAPKLERGLILGIKPRDNREKFQSYLDELSVENIQKNQADVMGGGYY